MRLSGPPPPGLGMLPPSPPLPPELASPSRARPQPAKLRDRLTRPHRARSRRPTVLDPRHRPSPFPPYARPTHLLPRFPLSRPSRAVVVAALPGERRWLALPRGPCAQHPPFRLPLSTGVMHLSKRPLARLELLTHRHHSGAQGGRDFPRRLPMRQRRPPQLTQRPTERRRAPRGMGGVRRERGGSTAPPCRKVCAPVVVINDPDSGAARCGGDQGIHVTPSRLSKPLLTSFHGTRNASLTRCQKARNVARGLSRWNLRCHTLCS